MGLKPLAIIVVGIVGIVLVVLCPRWVYFNQNLMPEELNLGYRFITEPPAIPSISKMENGRKRIYGVIGAEPQIDYRELFLRVGLIVMTVICGLWGLRTKSGYNQKRGNLVRTSIEDTEKGTPNEGMHRSLRRVVRMMGNYRAASAR